MPDHPYSRVYDAVDTRVFLKQFTWVEQYVRFFDYRHWGPLGRFLPARVREAIGARWGWHRIAVARKAG